MDADTWLDRRDSTESTDRTCLNNARHITATVQERVCMCLTDVVAVQIPQSNGPVERTSDQHLCCNKSWREGGVR